MKPFLATDLTEDKQNTQKDGLEFLVQRPSAALTQSLETAAQKAMDTVHLSKLPGILRAGQWLMGAAAFLIIVGIVKSLINGTSLSEAFDNAPFLFWIAGGCLIGWLILFLLSARRSKRVLEQEESTLAFSNLDNIVNSIWGDLGVPATAPEIDILSFCYKNKEEEIKPVTSGLENSPYHNEAFRVFADGQMLYIADVRAKFAIPRSALRRIRRIDKRIAAIGWNKEEGINTGRYKEYKLRQDQYNCVYSKPYYILEFTHRGQDWGIYFPSYELPILQGLTGLTVE